MIARHRRFFPALVAVGLTLLSANAALRADLLVCSGGSAWGYGGSMWDNFTAEIDAAFGNQVTVVSNFNSLAQVMSFDALLLDLRSASGTLGGAEAANITAFAATGGRVLMMGENHWWTTWNNQVLAVVGGTYVGDHTGLATRLVVNEITNGAPTIGLSAAGIAGSAVGGTALYDPNFATLWGASQNVLTVLDANVWDDEFWSSNNGSVFGANVAAWLAMPVPKSHTLVAFQQGVDGYRGTVDTFLQENLPSVDNSRAATLSVDNNDPQGSGLDSQVLLRFEDIFGNGLGQIPTGPGVTIQSAQLELTTTNAGSGGALHRMLQPWSDSDTWDLLSDGVQADGVEALSTADFVAGEDGGVPTGVSSFDVTASLQAWHAYPESNLGWAFLPFGGDGWDFFSAESGRPPRLIVSYVPEPSTFALLCMGAVVLLACCRRRGKR